MENEKIFELMTDMYCEMKKTRREIKGMKNDIIERLDKTDGKVTSIQQHLHKMTEEVKEHEQKFEKLKAL